MLKIMNRAKTTLSTGIDDDDLSLTVADGSGFPTTQHVITIDGERILVASRSGNTFTLTTRGYDNSSAAAHSAGAAVELRLCAAVFDEIQAEIAKLQTRVLAYAIALGGGGSGGGTSGGFQRITRQQLTDAASIDWNMGSGPHAYVTLGGNRTMNNPTNYIAGEVCTLTVIQDSTGTRTLTWGSKYLWPGNVDPTLTSTGDAVDVFVFLCDGTNLLCIGATFDVK